MDIRGIGVWLKGAAAGAATVVVGLLGGWDLPLRALLLLIVLDYAGGVLQAAFERKLSSTVGFKGICKKAYYLILIGAVYALEQAIEPGFEYGHTALTIFLALNELLSIIQHGQALGVAIPGGLREMLDRLLKRYGPRQGGGSDEQDDVG